MTASWVAISSSPRASTTSSQSVKNRSGPSATPSRDKNANATTLRMPLTSRSTAHDRRTADRHLGMEGSGVDGVGGVGGQQRQGGPGQVVGDHPVDVQPAPAQAL